MKTLIVIPALNAVATLAALIEGVRSALPDAEILIIDDGSTDGTASLAESLAVGCQRLGRNLGKGAALRQGFIRAVAQRYRRVLTLDADLQHDPVELPGFLAAAVDSKTVVIGRRLRRRPMPWQRQLSNFLVSLVTSWAAGQKLPDAQCGYRLLPVSLLRQIQLSANHYELEMELLIKAGRAGYRISSVPIQTIYSSSKSSIRPFLDTIRFLLLLVRSLFW
ncbi:MAG: glycosyltransferase family 2 protein [bacterium]